MARLKELEKQYGYYVADTTADDFIVPGDLDFGGKYVAFDYDIATGNYYVVVESNSLEELEYLLKLTQKDDLTFYEAGLLGRRL